MDTKDGKNGRLNDKADWPEKEQRFFNALGPSPEEEAKERRAASEEKSGGVGAGDGAAGDEPRKKEEIKAESAAATAHFCLFRETAPLTKWPDKRNRTRGAIARNARSPWVPCAACIARTIDYLSSRVPAPRGRGTERASQERRLEKIQRWIPARRRSALFEGCICSSRRGILLSAAFNVPRPSHRFQYFDGESLKESSSRSAKEIVAFVHSFNRRRGPFRPRAFHDRSSYVLVV